MSPIITRIPRFAARVIRYLWGEIKVCLKIFLSFTLFFAVCTGLGYIWLAMGLSNFGVGDGPRSMAALRPLGVGTLLVMSAFTIGIMLLLVWQAASWLRTQWREAAP